MERKNKVKVLEQIVMDMEDDIKKFDGSPFNGETVGEYYGGQGAAIIALANIVKSIIEKDATNQR